MKIAVTIWETRISPVFDSARNLILVESDGAEIVDRKTLLVDARQFNSFLKLLIELEVKVLICGALCEGPARILDAHGIEVIPFLTGEAEQVVERYLQGHDLTVFSLPGCRWCACRGRRGTRNNLNRSHKEDGKCRKILDEAREAKGRMENGDGAVARRNWALEAGKAKGARVPEKAADIEARECEKEQEAARDVADRDSKC
jgi:predicted Fe-Mo cluster-binding NifX family protein